LLLKSFQLALEAEQLSVVTVLLILDVLLRENADGLVFNFVHARAVLVNSGSLSRLDRGSSRI